MMEERAAFTKDNLLMTASRSAGFIPTRFHIELFALVRVVAQYPSGRYNQTERSAKRVAW
jgi:hypothetical protein